MALCRNMAQELVNLTYLNLESNDISIEGYRLLIESFHKFTNLQFLNLFGKTHFKVGNKLSDNQLLFANNAHHLVNLKSLKLGSNKQK